MGFIFSSKKEEKNIAIFDIGSGSVGGAVVRISPSLKDSPSILRSTRTDIKFNPNKETNFDLFTKDIISALHESAESIYKMKAGAPSEIFCVLSSPLYLSETRTIKVEKKTSFIFTKKMANDLIQKEISSLMELYKGKYEEIDSTPDIIEQHVMSVSLNGYKVEDPIGKRCKFFEINLVISLVPRLFLNKIKEVLSKTFHHTEVSFSSFTLATYLAVRDKYIKPDSYLLIDISGEITDVGIVTNGVLKSIASFPFGKKNFFKYVCNKLKLELRDVKELFKLYSDNNLSAPFKKKVDPVFDAASNLWGESFKKCVNTLPRTLILPNVIFLTIDDDIKNWFVTFLTTKDYIQSMVSDNKCHVVTLEGPLFLNTCNVKSGSCDPFLMIESIAYSRKKNK